MIHGEPETMCSNIKPLLNFEPAATAQEFRAAALPGCARALQRDQPVPGDCDFAII